uniref:Nuclear Testis protein N-terminal domain-containing protein n=1 Tax=Catagonus wagneri TaxID=51154 RepID=A0A8C3WNA8_9CETA
GSSSGASPLLGTDVFINPGASLSSFTAMSFSPPTPGPQQWPPWEQHLPPPTTPSLPPGSTLLLPANLRTPLVANAGHGPTATGACNITVQARSEVRPALPYQTQPFGLTQGLPQLSGSAVCPAPLFIATPAVQSVVSTPAVAATQAGMGGRATGLPPQAAPPAAQMTPILPPVTSGPWPHSTARAGSLHASKNVAPQDKSSAGKSVYENFRRWQRFKSLAQRHLPQSPDAEALSCFLIPVLRSLARLKPTMTLEEGLRQAMQEWQHTSNFDKMAFYEMAAKFMEFEEEDKMLMQNLQCMKGTQGLPPPAPKVAPRGPAAPNVGSRPVTHLPTGGKACAPRKPGSRAQPTRPKPRRSRRPHKTKAPREIPPEAVTEYVDIMEALLGPGPSATGDSAMECGDEGNELLREEDGSFPDPDLLSYIDKLCSQEDFVTKVEAVIHPRFLAELLSPKPELDLSALAEELEQEEGLTPEELVQKRLLASKEEEGVWRPRNHRAPRLDSKTSESATSQDAQRNDQGPQPRVRDEACTAEIDFEALQSHSQTESDLFRLKGSVASPGSQAFPLSWAGQPSPPWGPRLPGPGSGPRATRLLREASALREAGAVGKGSSEDEEELPSLAFLLDPQHNLLHWGLPQSPVSVSGGRSAQQAPRAPFHRRTGLSSGPPAAAKSRKRALCGSLDGVEKTPVPRADLGVSGRPSLALGLVHSSQPKKRREPGMVRGSLRRLRAVCSQEQPGVSLSLNR